ncbi:hypothetical protein STENM327S_01589 [Streptomyces tendae]
MEPAVLGGKLASSMVAPLVKKLFVTGGPGAGLVDRPVRLDRLVSFRGERRHLGETEVGKLAGRLVGASLDSPASRPFGATRRRPSPSPWPPGCSPSATWTWTTYRRCGWGTGSWPPG